MTSPRPGTFRDMTEMVDHATDYIASLPGETGPGEDTNVQFLDGVIDRLQVTRRQLQAQLNESAAPTGRSTVPLINSDAAAGLRERILQHFNNGDSQDRSDIVRYFSLMAADVPRGDEDLIDIWLQIANDLRHIKSQWIIDILGAMIAADSNFNMPPVNTETLWLLMKPVDLPDFAVGIPNT